VGLLVAGRLFDRYAVTVAQVTTFRVSLDKERELLARGGRIVGGLDEVGRGSVFGPVGVGVVLCDGVSAPPEGLADSKLLSPKIREALVVPIKEWALAWGVGYASAQEIDVLGISRALGVAGARALLKCGVEADWVIVDGSYNWLKTPTDVVEGVEWPDVHLPHTVTMVKADQQCASVAAASVLAKVDRDELIRHVATQYPGYGLEKHKGYLTPVHTAALLERGPSTEHRRSFRLPGVHS
jgi:ribonuclease HII